MVNIDRNQVILEELKRKVKFRGKILEIEGVWKRNFIVVITEFWLNFQATKI